MGIYITGMEMPCEEAEPLRIELYADGTVIVIKEQDDFYEFKAVPVPPHGRLIDADAFFDDLLFPSKQFEQGMRELIGDAPTIIEAEED